MLQKNNHACEISVQVFSGSFLNNAISFEALEKKLKPLLSRLHINKLIMGWSFSKELYLKTAEFLAKHNIEFFLWFPVFSETGSVRSLAGLVDMNGEEIHYDQSNYKENFSFCCPNDPSNTEKILDIFEKDFASIPFDGIFLDKIRYPSFGQGSKKGDGYRSVFSCFCNHCLKKYNEEFFCIDDLERALSFNAPTLLGIKSYNGNSIYEFNDPVITHFFLLKSSFIQKSLISICDYFRERKLGIGLDVFAPFLASFTGQDLITLSGICDFIKPMMYRITQAPAGLPFETQMFLSEAGSLNNTYTDNNKDNNENIIRQFDCILGIDSMAYPFDLDFAAQELKNLAVYSQCPVYAGLEINRIDNIADTNPDYIKKTIRSYMETGIRGLALSWDLMDVPEENLEMVIEEVQHAPGI